MPGHQQEALAALSPPADLAAVVRRFVHRVAIVAQDLVNLVEQMPTARGQPRHVLEHDQFDRVISPCRAYQPDAAQRQLVERLVLRRATQSLGQQPEGALVRATR